MTGPSGAGGVTKVGESAHRILRHVVYAVHAGSGEPVAVSAGFADPPPPGWDVRTAAAGTLAVTSPVGGRPATLPLRLRVAVADPAVAVRLAAPESVIELDDGVVKVRFVPLPATLEITLVTDPDATQPHPATPTVTVHPTKGTAPAVPLTKEPGRSGCYRSAPTVWTEDFHPFEIRVNGSLLENKGFLDTARRTTRIRVIDTS